LEHRSMDDFVIFFGYKPRQFWDVVDRFWNPELFDKVDGIWQLKPSVYSDLMGD